MSENTAQTFRRALPETDVSAVGMASAVVNGWCVLIARHGDTYHALNDRCSHAASPLSTGRIRHGTIMCPLHGARFELANGKCIGGAYRDVRSFPVRAVDGWIEVAVPDEPLGLAELPVIPA